MAAMESLVICKFAPNQRVQCWGGGDYVEGDASQEAGLTSRMGKFKLFAGLRNDPFFFNLAGFAKVAADVAAVAPML
ncbi:MAG: hypothetical protein HYZ81_19245, partial [Nitrospinae bacterium]|nr:hypothetical protein [Nitrospinota bacterium]